MKSLTKFCLIVASVFAVLGVVGVVAGMCLGARPSQFMRMVRYNGGRVLSNHSLHLDFWNDWNDWTDWDDDIEDIKDDVDEWKDDLKEDWGDWKDDMDEWGNLPAIDEMEVASAETVDTIEGYYGGAHTEKLILDLYRSSVKIYTHDSEDIRIVAKNAKDYFHIKENGNTLLLEDHRNLRRKDTLLLEIYLPKRTLEKIEMELGASVVYVEELRAEKLEMELGASEAKVRDIEAEKLEIDIGAGELQLQNVSASEKAVLEVGTGVLEAKSFTGGNLDLQCGVGTLDICIQGKESDYNYKMSCGIGNIDLNGRSHSGLGHEESINNHAEKKIIMECGIGEIALEFEE